MLLRVYIRLTRKRPQGLDDLFLALAWSCSIAFAICAFICVGYGVGLKIELIPLEAQEKAIHATYFLEIFYYASIFFVKMSLMGLYFRMAGALKIWFWKATVITTILITIQFISTIIVTAIQCRPIAKYWDPSITGTCININIFFYSTNVFTIISDLVMLSLPIPLLWSIERPRKERLCLIAAFSIGLMSTITSGVRLYSIRIFTLSTEPTEDAAPITTWSFLEINLGILCASGPVMKALFAKYNRPCHSPTPEDLEQTAWVPKRNFQITTTVDRSSYAGTVSRVQTQSITEDQTPPSVWNSTGTVEGINAES